MFSAWPVDSEKQGAVFGMCDMGTGVSVPCTSNADLSRSAFLLSPEVPQFTRFYKCFLTS